MQNPAPSEGQLQLIHVALLRDHVLPQELTRYPAMFALLLLVLSLDHALVDQLNGYLLRRKLLHAQNHSRIALVSLDRRRSA